MTTGTRYEMENELRDRLEDERRMKKQKQQQYEMREYLARQVAEKREREVVEKKFNDEQADMWKKDLENYTVEERTLNDKIKKLNKDNADFLMMQMTEKTKGKGAKMNANEHQLNRQLLKEINEKRKVFSREGGKRSEFSP